MLNISKAYKGLQFLKDWDEFTCKIHKDFIFFYIRPVKDIKIRNFLKDWDKFIRKIHKDIYFFDTRPVKDIKNAIDFVQGFHNNIMFKKKYEESCSRGSNRNRAVE